MKRAIYLILALLTLLAALIMGYGIRAFMEILAARDGWHVGGEALALLAIPAAVLIGAKVGRDWAVARYGQSRSKNRR